MIEQLELFGVSRRMEGPPRRRPRRKTQEGRGSHEHSRAAHARLAASRVLQGRREEVAAWVDLHGPCTVRNILEGLFGAWADMDLVRPRVTELLEAGTLREVGKTRDHATGRLVMLVDMANRSNDA